MPDNIQEHNMKENKISEKAKIVDEKSEEISETTEIATEQSKNIANQLNASGDEKHEYHTPGNKKPMTVLQGILCFCVGAAIGAGSVTCVKNCFSK